MLAVPAPVPATERSVGIPTLVVPAAVVVADP